MKNKQYIIILVIILFFVSGQAGCAPEKTEAKSGLNYELISGVDYLSAGKTLEQGDTFYVGIKIENYDQQERMGQVCVRDDVDDSFGGIPSYGKGDCKFFNVKEAEVRAREATGFGQAAEEIKPGITEIYFPEGEYSYYGLPSSLKPWNQKLFVSLEYRQTSQVTGTVTVPSMEQPTLSQEPASIFVTVTKSIRKRQDAYKVDLDIMLKKQQEAKIFSADFSKKNVTYFRAELVPQELQCSIAGKPITNLIEFENEKLIKCSALVYSAGEVQSYPLIMTLDYGVALEKNYGFAIKAD